MSATDLHYLQRHPLRWASHFWPHFVVSFAMLAMAVLSAQGVFETIPLSSSWPWLVGAGAPVIFLSAFMPDSRRVQFAVATGLLGMAVFRAMSLFGLLVTRDIPTRVYPLVGVLICHWVVIGTLGIVWPWITQECALRATTEAGRLRVQEVRGAGGGHGAD